MEFVHGDTNLPMFNFKDCGDCDLVSVLLNPKLAIVCKHVPLRCEKNASFLIDTRSLKHPNDWKSDDLGSYHNLGRGSKGYFDISDEVCFSPSRAHPDVLATQFNSRKVTGLTVSIATSTVEATNCGVGMVKGEGTFWCSTCSTTKNIQ